MEKRTEKIIRVAVVGPESTGKSVLCEQLAEHYQTVFVPEFAREYLNTLGRPYTYEDLQFIAEQQMDLEKKMELKANRVLFCDTTLLSVKIWFQVIFKRVPDEIVKGMDRTKYDLFLLTDIDMPWVADPLREHPHFRKELLEMHLDELKRTGTKFALINGLGAERTKNALSFLNGCSDLFVR